MAFCDLVLVIRPGSGSEVLMCFPDSRGRRHRPHFIMGGVLVNMWPCFKNITTVFHSQDEENLQICLAFSFTLC